MGYIYLISGRGRRVARTHLEVCTAREWGTVRRTQPGFVWELLYKIEGDEAKAERLRGILPADEVSYGWYPGVFAALEQLAVELLPTTDDDYRALGIGRSKPPRFVPSPEIRGLGGRLARRRATGATPPAGPQCLETHHAGRVPRR